VRLDEVVTGVLSQPAELERFTFQGSAGQRIYFDSLNPTNRAGFNARLYGPGGDLILQTDADLDSGPHTLLESGTYVFEIRSEEGAVGEYSYRLLDAVAAAAPMTLDTTVNDQLSPPLAAKLFRFDATAGQRLQLLTGGASGFSGFVTVSDAANQYLAGANLSSVGEQGSAVVERSGTVLVAVANTDPTGAALNFILRLNRTDPTPTPPAGFGVLHEGSVADGEIRTVTFAAPAGTPVALDGQLDDQSGDSYIEILRPDGNAMALVYSSRQDLLPGRDLPIVLPQSGNYTVRIYGPGSPPNTGSGNYRFRILNLNDSPALALDTVVNISSGPLRQLDLYRLNGLAGRRVAVDWLEYGDGSVGRTIVGTLGILEAWGGASDGDPVQLPFVGLNYLAIQRNAETSLDSSMRILDLDAATPVAFDTDVQGTLDPPTGTRWYRFSGTVGQRLVLQTLGNTDPSVGLGIFRPGFAQILVPWLGNNQEVELPVTGSYSLRVTSTASSGVPVPFGFRLGTPDTIVRPLTLGAVTSGSFQEPRERREFRFNGTIGQRLIFDGLSSQSSSLYYLLSPRGTVYTSGWIYSDSAPITLPETGGWTVRIVADASFDVGDFSFRLIDVSQAPAVALAAGTVASGVLNEGANPANACLVFRVATQAGQRLFFDSRTNSGFYAQVFGPNDLSLFWNQSGQDGPDLLVSSPGDTLVVVSAPQPDPTPYDFQILSPFLGTENLSFGQTQTLTLSNVGDQVTYAINATAGQVGYFDSLIADDAFKAIAVSLTSDTGESVMTTTFGADSTPFQFPRTGTYFLRVGGLNDAVGPVSFRLLDLATVPEIPVGADTAGTLTAPRGSAVYRFSAAANQRVRFESIAVGPGLSTWTLYGPDLTALRSGNLTQNLEETPTRKPGAHYLVVSPMESPGNLAANQSFTVRRQVSVEPPTSVSGLNVTLEGTVDPLGNAEFTFTAPAGHRVFYDSQSSFNSSFNVSLSFGGVPLSSSQASFDGDFTGNPVPRSLPFSGTYTVRIEDSGGGGGSYRFRVVDLESVPSVSFGSTVTDPAPLAPLEARFFKLPATSGQVFLADWTQPIAGTMVLFGPAGNSVLTEGAIDSYFRTPITFTGDHLLMLSNGTEADASYGVRILDLAGSGAETVAFNTPKDFELPPQELRVFRLNLSAGQKIFVDVADAGTHAYLYPPGSYNSPVSTSGDYSHVAQINGIYYIVIGNDTDAPIGRFLRVIEGTSSTQSLALDSPAQTGSLSSPGAERRFTFTGAAGQRLYFDTLMASSLNEPRVHLIPPGGTTPSLTWTGGQDYGPLTLPSGGIWTLLVENHSDTALDYAFRLLNVDAAPRIVWDTPFSTDLAPRETRLYRFTSNLGQRVTIRGPEILGSWSGMAYRLDDNWTASLAYTPHGYSLMQLVLDDLRDYVLVLSSSEEALVPLTLHPFLGNHAPILAEVPDATVDEEVAHIVHATASDIEQPNDRVRFSLGGSVPPGAVIDPVSGEFSWTPTEAQGPGVFPITVVATDDGIPALSSSRVFAVTVLEANSPPALAAIPNQTVAEETTLTFTAVATDPDLPANPLTYSLAGTVPEGAAIDPATGVFTWTPTEAQGPGTYTVEVVVTDASSDTRAPQLADRKPVSIAVTEVNRTPVLAEIPNQSVDELKPLAISVAATDADLPANGLTHSLAAGAPEGITIDRATGAISWTPTEAQGPGTYPVTVVVTDSGSADAANPTLSVSRSFTIEVREVNEPPTLPENPELTVVEGTLAELTLTGADSDLPPQTLAYRLSEGFPPGVTLEESTGLLRWTPAEVQGPSTNLITITVTDSGTPPLSAQRIFSILVLETNAAPVLAHIPDQFVRRQESLSLTLDAADTDLPPQQMIFSLLQGPAGMTVAPDGLVSWIPEPAQRPSTNAIRVQVSDGVATDETAFEVVAEALNTPPVLPEVPPQTLPENIRWSLPLNGTDGDLPAQTLTYTVIAGPEGVEVSATGEVSWTPNEAQGPSTNSVTVSLSDGIASVERTFTVIVTEVNDTPTLAELSPQTIPENAPWSLTLSGADVDLPPQILTYSLVTGPDGLTVSGTGEVSWTPSEVQGPTNSSVTVRLSDGTAHAERTFLIVVTEENEAPALGAVEDQDIEAGIPWSVTLQATDPDLPQQTFQFGKADGPESLTVSSSGLVSWTPPADQGLSTNSVTVTVSDGQAEASRTFILRVFLPDTGFQITVGDFDPQTGQLELRWTSRPGQQFRLEFQTALGLPWQSLGEPITATGAGSSTVVSTAEGDLRLYRLVQIP